MKAGLYIRAHTSQEWSEGLSWAYVPEQDVAALMADLRRLSKVVVDHKLRNAVVSHGAEFGPEDVAQDLRILSTELVVYQNDFWFEAHPKNEAMNETEMMHIDWFVEAVENGQRHFAGDHLPSGSEAVRAFITEIEESVAEAA